MLNTGMTSDTEDTRYLGRPPVGIVDRAMVLLAVASVVYLVWITFWHVSDRTGHWIAALDYVVCAIFFVEFLWRWRKEGRSWRFPLTNWYEVLGMIPVASPIFHGHTFIRSVVILARLGRAVDRAFGERITARVVDKFVKFIVGVIKRPITIAVLDEVVGVLQTGHYTRNIARALDENHRELDAMVVELILKDPTAGKFRFVPFHDDIIRLVADTVLRIVHQLLQDPRTDELVSDMLRENVEQIKATVHERYKHEGAGASFATEFKPADRPQESFDR